MSDELGRPHDWSGLTRRELLTAAAVGVTAVALDGLLPERAAARAEATPVTLPGFRAFAKSVRTFRSGAYYLVESNGLPAHGMMVGITSWQQQVPVPEAYTGAYAWRFPVKPVLAAKPISARTNLFRGAIALAVNGVPIFNALNNRSEDSHTIGELDEWGGHCGRGDDYHYHVAPLHLTTVVGVAQPIAYALDGFPIYGLREPDGSKVKGLDELNGHFDAKGHYHYHGTTTYPYLNGGMRGRVTVAEGQISPQPTAKPFRPAGEPLPGARITAFSRTGASAYSLTYTLAGGVYHIDYTADLKSVSMTFTDAAGQKRTEHYER